MLNPNHSNIKRPVVYHFEDDPLFSFYFKQFAKRKDLPFEIEEISDPKNLSETNDQLNLIAIVTDSFMFNNKDNFSILSKTCEHLPNPHSVFWLTSKPGSNLLDSKIPEAERAKELGIEKSYKKGKDDETLIQDLSKLYYRSAIDTNASAIDWDWTAEDDIEFRKLARREAIEGNLSDSDFNRLELLQKKRLGPNTSKFDERYLRQLERERQEHQKAMNALNDYLKFLKANTVE